MATRKTSKPAIVKPEIADAPNGGSLLREVLERASNPHPEDLADHVEEIETRSAAGEALYTIYTDIRRRLR